ncbi:MAG: 4Fe-4S binding protein [Firmicutes bacterium]|nr:4Fe-4S binding protein [Bacillota bacterium]
MNRTVFNAERCKGCGLCVDACPKKIIALEQDTMNSKGYHPAHVTEPEKCIACSMCAMMCPDTVITVIKEV